jgi:hypothetical protein
LIVIAAVMSTPYRLLKNFLGVLRRAQDERREFDIIGGFPFMLRLLEAFRTFFNSLLTIHKGAGPMTAARDAVGSADWKRGKSRNE